MAELRIGIDGPDDSAVDELWVWLTDQPALRGHLARRVTAAPPGTMSAGDVAIVVSSAAALVTAVAQVLSIYFAERARQQRPAITVRVGGPTGEVSIDVGTVSAQECERLLKAVIRAAHRDS